MNSVRSDLVDAYWAEVFDCSVDQLRQMGVHVYVHSGPLQGRADIYVLQLGQATHVSMPPGHKPLHERVLQSSRYALLGEETWRRILDRKSKMFGPSIHHYREAPLSQTADDRVRVTTPNDDDVVEQFRSSVSIDDWNEGGFADEQAIRYALFVDGEIVAMAKLSEWRSSPSDVGVVTHPALRRQGYGVAVAARAADDAIKAHGAARYRALETNTASRRIADRLGFWPYGRNVVVR